MQILFLVLKKLSLAESECLCVCVSKPALLEANSLTWSWATCIVHLVVAACIVQCKDREKSAGDDNLEGMMLKSLKR